MLLLLALLGMVSIIPLSVLAATGSVARAWEALRGYMFCMFILIAPVLLIVVITMIPALWT